MNEFNLSALNSLSDEEREFALKILADVANTNGNSQLYNELKYEDYEEIPVDIETFLKDDTYLGKGLVNEEGKFTVYPYWVNVLKELFPDPTAPCVYNTLALSGAIGLGKSFVAVLCGLYELYRMLCLKDPYLHYGLQPIDKITFAFMNITLDASKGVAWDKCQQLLQASPWFMSKGTVSGSTNLVWNPPKGIELIAGSLSRHIIGRAVYWCLDGDTEIATNIGDIKLKELVGKEIKVYNITDSGEIQLSESCTVLPTATETTEYQIILEDDTVIKCTPTHRFLLSDGTYREAQHLSEDDDILEFTPYGYVYKVTNLCNNKFYIGKRVCNHFDDKYWGSGKILKDALNKYGKDNFSREILSWARNKEELETLEKHYIETTNAINEGYNITTGGTGGNTTSGTIKITNGVDEKHLSVTDTIPDGWFQGSKTVGIPHQSDKYKQSWTDDRRALQSKKMSGEGNSQYGNGDAHRGIRNGRFGKPTSDSTKKKIGDANRGKKRSEEQKKKLSESTRGVTKPEGFGAKVSSSSIGKRAHNNGSKNIWVMKDDVVPDGFVKGWIKK